MSDYVFTLFYTIPGSPQQSCQFHDFPARVGRGSANAVIIDHESVDEVHAVLGADEAGFLVISDMASTTGIFVDGQQVDKAIIPESGEFRLGNVSCRLTYAEAASLPPQPPPSVSAESNDDMPLNIRPLGRKKQSPEDSATNLRPLGRAAKPETPSSGAPPLPGEEVGSKTVLVVRYFYKETTVDGLVERGPLRRREVEQAIAKGEIHDETQMRTTEDNAWAPAANFIEFETALDKAPIFDPNEEKRRLKEQKRAAKGKPQKPVKTGKTIVVNGYEVGYAGFWRRFFAYIIDGFMLNFILALVTLVVMAILFFHTVVSMLSGGGASPEDLEKEIGTLAVILLYGSWIVTCYLYFVKSESGTAQGTLGKRCVGIMVTDVYGSPVSSMRALFRNLAKVFSGFTFCIGFLMAMLPPRKRALHDMMTGCLVVESPRGANSGCLIVSLVMIVLVGAGALVAGVGGSNLNVFAKAREKARRVNDAGNLKQIGLAALMYSGDHQGHFPRNIWTLAEENYLLPGKAYICPHGNTTPPASADDIRNGQCDYVWLPYGPRMDKDGRKKVIAHTKPGIFSESWINVLFVDGHVEGLSMDSEQWQRIVSEQ